MRLSDFISACLEQHYNAMLRALNGLTPQEIRYMPTPQSSSIGFLVWHYARTLDRWIHARLQNAPQLWEQGWASRLEHPAGPNDTGYGYTPQQLQTFQTPNTDALLQYAQAALQSAQTYLAARADADFDTIPVANPRGGPMTLADMCQQLIWEFNQHGGQIAYLRGMQRGLEDPAYSGGLLETLARQSAPAPDA